MTSQALAVDTTDTILIGEGTVSLRDETLDLLLKPRPKDKSILVLRSPLHIAGTFKDPSFRPDFKALGIRGAVALALGSIARRRPCWRRSSWGRARTPTAAGSMRSRVTALLAAPLFARRAGARRQAGHAVNTSL